MQLRDWPSVWGKELTGKEIFVRRLISLSGFLSFVVVVSLLQGCSKDNDSSIVASPNDQREYRHIQLPSQLDVLLISDPTADKAAASLDVYIGSYQNPRDRAGLVHFLEHMLFLGTEKYPIPANTSALSASTVAATMREPGLRTPTTFSI